MTTDLFEMVFFWYITYIALSHVLSVSSTPSLSMLSCFAFLIYVEKLCQQKDKFTIFFFFKLFLIDYSFFLNFFNSFSHLLSIDNSLMIAY